MPYSLYPAKGVFMSSRAIQARPCSAGLLFAALTLACSPAIAAGAEQVVIGERPVILHHLQQEEIEAGRYTLEELFNAGQRLFDARFNILDGQSRPASTGTGAARDPSVQPTFIRTSAPDSNSCAGCHAQPSSGGSGDFVANVFVLAQALDPVTDSISDQFSNERNTLGMFGAGAIEMLAREMSADLIRLREQALHQASEQNQDVEVALQTKDVSFGSLVARPDGKIDPTGIEGVDWDLIIKPFHQKGAVVSLREFSNNAMNHHHGMQSTERFGIEVDPDQDGVFDELSTGDMTAVTVFQAALPAPQMAKALNPAVARAVKQGRASFDTIGCGRCHRSELRLDQREFSEPNPFNPPGNLQLEDASVTFSFDLVETSKSALVRPAGKGQVAVQAYTDLKRHNLNDADFSHFDNEQLSQGSLLGFADAADFSVPPQPQPTGQFLTRKLWDAGNSDPYGHRGDLTTLTEAIHFHGGDARDERDAFFDLPDSSQAEIIEFLKAMVMPE